MRISALAAFALTSVGLSLAAPTSESHTGSFSPVARDDAQTPTLTGKAIVSKTGDNGVTTPLPIQPGMVDNCNRFYLVKKDDICQTIATNNGIPLSTFYEWNPSVGSDCRSMWADAYVCTQTIGYVPPVWNSCYANTDYKLWGNKEAALAAVATYCTTGSAPGAGLFAVGQTKKGCVNTSDGNKFNFRIDNHFGRSSGLTGNKCKEFLSLPINNCERGGQASTLSWVLEATLTAGQC